MTEEMIEYAKCVGQGDGYHAAAEPYTNGDTSLLDVDLADVAAIQDALDPVDWRRFQDNRALGLAEWEARIAEIQTTGNYDSPVFEEHAIIAWECGEQRQRLALAGLLPN